LLRELMQRVIRLKSLFKELNYADARWNWS